MNNSEIIFKNIFLFYFGNIMDVLPGECLSNKIQITEDVFLYNIRSIVYNNFTLDDIHKELDKGNIDEAKCILEKIKNQIDVEQRCQLIVFDKLNIFGLICDEISIWTKKFNLDNCKAVDVISKKILSSLVNNNMASSLLSLTVDYDDNNMIDAFNIHGSNIQNSDKYLEIIDDNDTTVINCVFQPTDENYLVTLRRENNIEVSKYTNSNQHLEFIIKYSLFIATMN